MWSRQDKLLGVLLVLAAIGAAALIGLGIWLARGA
jgi:hypothetical protein